MAEVEFSLSVEPPVGLQASFLSISFPDEDSKKEYIKLEAQATHEALRSLWAAHNKDARYQAKVELYKARLSFMKKYTEENDYDLAVSTV